MQIQGIRSYPPHESAVIEFQTPLTLIVGKNGTGKTVRTFYSLFIIATHAIKKLNN